MARPQFFKGDYGGPLGSYDTAARLVAQAGQTQGAAMAGLGGNIAGAIEKYQLNKEERAKIMGRLDRYMTPEKVVELTSTGVEDVDKKRQSALDKLSNQDANMKDLSYLDSLISTDIEMESQAAKQRAQALDMLTKQQGLLLGKERLKGEEFENKLNALTEKDQIRQQGLKTEAQEIAVRHADLTWKFDQEQNPEKKKKLGLDIEKLRVEKEILERNDLFDKKAYDSRLAVEKQKKTLGEQDIEKGKLAIAESRRDATERLEKYEAGTPDFTTPGEAKKAQEEWEGLGMTITFKPAEFGKGFVIDTIEGEVENVWTPVPEAPGHFLYGGAVLRLDELPSGKKKVTKLGTQQVSENARLRISVLGALKDPAAVRYMTVRRKTDADDRADIIKKGEGTYEYEDAEGNDFEEEYDAAMEDKIKAIEAYEKYLGAPENLGDPLKLR